MRSLFPPCHCLVLTPMCLFPSWCAALNLADPRERPLTLFSLAFRAAYVAATLASCTIAVSLSSLVPRLRGISPATRSLLGKLVPFVAVASAGCVNIGLMRWKEIRDGRSSRIPATKRTTD